VRRAAGAVIKSIDCVGDDASALQAQTEGMKKRPATANRPAVTPRGGQNVAVRNAAVIGHVVAGGKHGSGRLLALALGLTVEVVQKRLDRLNARVQRFPSLDLGDGVEWDTCRLRHFLDLRETAGVQVLKKGFKNRCHAPILPFTVG